MRGKSFVSASVMPVILPMPMLICPFETVTAPRPAKSDDTQPFSVLPSNNTPDSGIFPDATTARGGVATLGTAVVWATVSLAGALVKHGQVQPANRSIPERPTGS